MLSGPHQKFAEGIVAGKTYADAYLGAFPKSSADNARKHAPRLNSKPAVQAEIARLRAEAQKLAGSAVLTTAEKRMICAAIARAAPAELPMNSPLWQSIKRTKDGTEYRLPCKIAAMKLDNDLAGVGAEAEANKAIAVVVRRAWAK
jgi:hypothetical protein